MLETRYKQAGIRNTPPNKKKNRKLGISRYEHRAARYRYVIMREDIGGGNLTETKKYCLRYGHRGARQRYVITRGKQAGIGKLAVWKVIRLTYPVVGELFFFKSLLETLSPLPTSRPPSIHPSLPFSRTRALSLARALSLKCTNACTLTNLDVHTLTELLLFLSLCLSFTDSRF